MKHRDAEISCQMGEERSLNKNKKTLIAFLEEKK